MIKKHLRFNRFSLKKYLFDQLIPSGILLSYVQGSSENNPTKEF